jgi:hypothetical protein
MGEQSRRNVDLITQWIDTDEDRFNALVAIILLNEEPVSRRAAWVFSHLVEKYPYLVNNHVVDLISSLRSFSHTGLIRCVLRVFALNNPTLPEELQGELVDVCFQWGSDLKIPVGVRVHCFDIIFNMSKIYSELKPELLEMVRHELRNSESAGMISRCKKLEKTLAQK